MDYLTWNENYWSCDIESDDLRDQASIIHVVCVENIQTGEQRSFRRKKEFQEWAEESNRIFVGHNFLAFDAPVLNRLWGTRISVSQIVDTFLLSQMYNPSMRHGLGDWGERLGNPKLDFHDFSRYTPEMHRYCQQDVSLTAEVYRVLCKRMKAEGFSERGVELEHRAWNIIQNKQKQNGFPFDQEKADLLYAELRAREEQLKAEIYQLWPPVLQHVRTFASAFKKDGSRTISYQRHLGQYPQIEVQQDGTYHAYDYVSFDLGSPKQRIQKLLDHGWKPVNYTEKGNPKIDEDEMLAFAESSQIPEVTALAKWCVVNSRANMIRNWQQSVNPKTGNIHGSLFLASTVRYRHSKPNTANIPSSDALYGSECRSLWTSGGKEWVLVGIDAKGIQLRILAHYLNNTEFSEAILSSDPHAANQERMGLPSRSLTKTITYATLMSAGVGKIAQTAKVSMKEASEARQKFFSQVPELPRLVAYLQKELHQTGRITLCDGTRLLVSSDHMVIPYLLQGDESRLMKQAMIYIDEEIRRRHLTKDILFVGMIHDELQVRVHREYVDAFIGFALPCFERAGLSFDYLIPIEGTANIGDNWACTH